MDHKVGAGLVVQQLAGEEDFCKLVLTARRVQMVGLRAVAL